MYVYLTEDYIKTIMDDNLDDDNELVWKKTDLEYGDWSSGPNNDGTYTIQKSFIPSPVTDK